MHYPSTLEPTKLHQWLKSMDQLYPRSHQRLEGYINDQRECTSSTFRPLNMCKPLGLCTNITKTPNQHAPNHQVTEPTCTDKHQLSSKLHQQYLRPLRSFTLVKNNIHGPRMNPPTCINSCMSCRPPTHRRTVNNLGSKILVEAYQGCWLQKQRPISGPNLIWVTNVEHEPTHLVNQARLNRAFYKFLDKLSLTYKHSLFRQG